MRWLHVEATGSDSVFPPPITSMVMERAVCVCVCVVCVCVCMRACVCK